MNLHPRTVAAALGERRHEAETDRDRHEFGSPEYMAAHGYVQGLSFAIGYLNQVADQVGAEAV